MVVGTPNRAIQPMRKPRATVSVEVSVSSIASSQRVKRSTHVSRYVWPFAGGRGPTISMYTWSNWASGGEKDTVGLCTFVRWHWMHERVHRRTSALMLGHV